MEEIKAFFFFASEIVIVHSICSISALSNVMIASMRDKPLFPQRLKQKAFSFTCPGVVFLLIATVEQQETMQTISRLTKD